jgi:hypothetical protein
VAQIDADLRGRRRTFVRIGAAVLALVGVVALVVRPSRETRATARFTVPSPLAVSEVVRAIRSDAPGGARVTIDGRRVTATYSNSDSFVARTYARELARAVLDEARQRVNAVETRRARTARADRADVAAEMAAIASRTGLTDPETAYRERVDVVRNLEAQRARAAAAGLPLAAIDDQLAENQQAVFELRLQVTHDAELRRALNAADQRALEATRAIDTTDRAVRAASFQVSDRAVGNGFGAAPGVAALVIAGIGLLLGEWWHHRAARRGARPDDSGDAKAPAPSERYLTFYRALDPSAPPIEVEPVSAEIDLAYEELRDEREHREPEPAPEPDRFSRPG